MLGTLLTDVEPTVRSAAALALLSFPTDRAEASLKANLATDFKPLFVNALARRDPAPYLAELAEVIEKRLMPQHFWGGAIPAGVSWTILYEYVKARTAAELASGKLDRSLDALEKMQWFSSSEPRSLYALYLVRGLKVRAKRFRDGARKAISYDMETYFDMADKNPAAYVP